MWIGYVCVDDVDATADRVKPLGGAVHVPPQDVLHVSRFSVVSDPQMATIALFKWLEGGQAQPPALDAPGGVGWHELLAADWEKAWGFYGELFGWQKAETNVSSVGAYQQFSAGGQTIGGMFTQARDGAGPVLALLLLRRRYRRGDQTREGRRRADPRRSD